MRSSTAGKGTSKPEILSISGNGIWLFVLGKEYFLPYAEYPWFKAAPVKGVLNVRLLNRVHLHWPDLDIDLEVESLEYPDRYPLQFKTAQPGVVADGSRLQIGPTVRGQMARSRTRRSGRCARGQTPPRTER